MAVEPRRGCGYRKVGGLYFVGGGHPVFCDRLPIPLEVCPTCGHGIKQTRGLTWVQTEELVGGVHPNCADDFPCPLCMRPDELGRSALLWIGEKYYKTPLDFTREANELGISRRIPAIPRGFVVGKTWILFAHPKTIEKFVNVKVDAKLQAEFPLDVFQSRIYTPGIFRVWRPERIEIILPESRRGTVDETFAREKGLTPVFVPDNDPDHAAKNGGEENGEED